MIGHEHIDMDRATMLPCRFGQPAEIDSVIVLVEEDAPSIVAALYGMDRYVRQEKTALAGHGYNPCLELMYRSIVRVKGSDPIFSRPHFFPSKEIRPHFFHDPIFSEILEGTLHGLDLVEAVVAFDAFEPLLPEAPVARLHPGRRVLGPVGYSEA